MPYRSPILELEHNVIHAFQNASAHFSDSVVSAVREGQLDTNIDLISYPVPLKGPSISRPDKSAPAVMQVHLNHLEVLWAFIYGWMVLYEEDIQKPLMEGRNQLVHGATPLSAGALELLDWATNIKTVPRRWSKHLPSPHAYFHPREQYYGEKANLVFQQAAAYLLAHEFAHASSGHMDVIDGLSRDSPVRIELEKEADVKAFEIAIGADDGTGEWLSKPYAAVCAILSTYCIGGLAEAARAPTTHPLLHHRLCHLMSALNFVSEERRLYFLYFVCVCSGTVLSPSSRFQCGPVYETGEEWLQDVFDQLDNLAAGSTG